LENKKSTRGIFAACLLFSLFAFSACGSPVNQLKNVDWTHVVSANELGCNDPDHGPHLGVEVDAKQFADITGDNNEEAFVAVSCVPSTSSWPDRLEVYDGASNVAHPRRLAVLLDYKASPDGTNDGIGILIREISVSSKTVTVVSAGLRASDPNCCPGAKVTDKFTWDGSRFAHDSRSVVPFQWK